MMMGNFQNITAIPSSPEEDIIAFVRNIPTDAIFTEAVKAKVIAKIRQKDSGIIGAYQFFLSDSDLDGLKVRLTHRALTPSQSELPSSATTAHFQW
eukprot:CAMPEP_0202968618 /NCGR_PEP_ID=MMETSP1396-20130829/13978_1 /ASSEMBLY_ACC=CAM_ASM_000872 /TAXON_ID= /ORGANISM="Pseudokeronopsis sp., Strain Brazil" /LENGTH=95 /DNA_ID=CAMNT_0049695123 /DNA_START=95 /DNA_END=379 /DNA_ORIENTATION=+